MRLLDRTWPGVQTEFVKAMRKVQSEVVIQELEEAIRRGDVQAALTALRFDPSDLFRTDAAIVAAMNAGGDYQMEAIQAASRNLPAATRVVQSFGGRNERAERIARDLGSRLVTEVLDDTRVMIAEAIRNGLELGQNPLQTARAISGRMVNGSRQGGLVGLTSQQAGYVNGRVDPKTLRFVPGLRQELTDPATASRYFTRVRRDKRFDGIVRRAIAEGRPVAQADINRMAGRYSDRLLALRGETIARTETIKALNAGRNEAIDQLIESPTNEVQAQDVTRKWDSTGEDGKTRSSHLLAEGQARSHGEPFLIGLSLLMFPGDTSLGAEAKETINCRCYYEIIIDFFARLE